MLRSVSNSPDTALARIAPWILVTGLVIGGLSVDRLAGPYFELGHLGELRFILIAIAVCCAAILSLRPGSRDGGTRESLLWVAGVCGLHCLLILTWFWSTRSDFSTNQLFENVLLILALLAANRLFASSPGTYLLAFQWLSILIVVVITVAGLISGGTVQGEAGAIGAGGIGTARAVAVCFIYLAYLFLQRQKLVFLLPMPVLLLEMALSGSRAAFLGLVVGLAILWVFRKRLSTGSPFGWGALLLLIAVGAAVFAVGLSWAPTREIIVDFVVSNLVIDPAASQAQGLYLADRDLIFASAWKHFLDYFYTGSGLGSYTGPFGEQYPHNLVLNFADDAGLGAIVVFLALLAWPVLRLMRGRGSLAILALANTGFYAVVSLFTGTYYDARFIWVFLLLGLLLEGRKAPLMVTEAAVMDRNQ